LNGATSAGRHTFRCPPFDHLRAPLSISHPRQRLTTLG